MLVPVFSDDSVCFIFYVCKQRLAQIYYLQYQKVLLKILKMDVQEEQRSAEVFYQPL